MKKLLFLFAIMSAPLFAAPTALTVQTVSETAAAVNFQDADQTNGNYVANPNGDVCFVLYNADVSDSATVTITAQKTSRVVPGYGPMTKANLTVTLTAGQRKIVGPFPTGPWNDSNGRVQLTFAGTAPEEVSVAPFKVPSSR